MKASLPVRHEINVHDSLDEQQAAEHFLGRDLKQAEALFRENFLYYQEDLMWMGPQAFCFYVDAALAYLLSPTAAGDSNAVGSFCGVLEFQLENHRAEIAPAAARLRDAVRAILRDDARYDCDQLIHGDLLTRYRRLLDQLGA